MLNIGNWELEMWRCILLYHRYDWQMCKIFGTKIAKIEPCKGSKNLPWNPLLLQRGPPCSILLLPTKKGLGRHLLATNSTKYKLDRLKEPHWAVKCPIWLIPTNQQWQSWSILLSFGGSKRLLERRDFVRRRKVVLKVSVVGWWWWDQILPSHFLGGGGIPSLWSPKISLKNSRENIRRRNTNFYVK